MTKKEGRQAYRFHLPLHPNDTPVRTHGCRHTNPDICAKNAMSSVCAFVRADGMCLAPPASWAKQFRKLSDRGTGEQK